MLSCYFIMGSSNTGNRDPLYVLEEALKGGITCFQLREKGSGALVGNQKKVFAEACLALCKQYNVPFIVNDDIELAIEIEADGIHVGQDDMPGEAARLLAGRDKLVGVSVHNLDEAKRAIESGANYLGIGPIHHTKSKSDAKTPAGTSVVEAVHQQFPSIPIVAIGGLTEKNLAPVIKAGASGVAVISAIVGAKNVIHAALSIKEAVTAAKEN